MKNDQVKQVLLADDHPIVLLGLRELINSEPDMEVCGETGEMGEALKLLEKLKPDIAVVDISLGEGSGLELIKHAKSRGLSTPILAVSVFDEAIYAERVVRAGGMGFVTKRDLAGTLVTAIRQVLAGRVFLSAKITGHMLGRAAGREDAEEAKPLAELSDRDLEILELTGRGLTAQEIGKRLHLSIKTIDTYRRHLKSKLNIENNNELAVYAANWLRDQQ